MRKDSLIRKRHKEIFVLKHLVLSEKSFVQSDAQSLVKLVSLARVELNYSDKTVDCDIRRSLREAYKRVEVEKGEDNGKVKEA